MTDSDDTITLAAHELHMAATVGLRRQVSSVITGLQDRHGMNPEDGWRAHIEGACGELAVAKYLRKYWDGSVDTFRTLPDLGNVEIRTRSRHDYELIIRPDDDTEKYYVLVTGRAPHYRIRGYILGAAARCDQWVQRHGGRSPAWFVPSQALIPLQKPKEDQ